MNLLVRRVFALLIFAVATMGAGAQAQTAMLPTAENLQQLASDAQAAGKPLVLMFSLPECPYCKVVRRNYLGPMLREANPPMLRELTMNSRQSIHDYDGSWTTPTAIAKRYGVVVAPTLVFVDGSGEMLVEPLVGGDHQFYDAYLERAFDESQKKLVARKNRGR
jgi:thioredoxin-related protein